MLVKIGDLGLIFCVRFVELDNMGEICRGEGGGDGNGIIVGCKGDMY